MLKNILIILLGIICLVFGSFLFTQKKDFNKDSENIVFHTSYFITPEISDRGFDVAKNTQSVSGVKGILVNHHLLASDLIATEFLRARESNPELVIVLAPNHFIQGDGKIIISNANWHTPYGVLEGEHDVVEKLALSKNIFIDEGPFENEHGISGIIPFVKKIFPDTKVLPVIFKPYTTKEEIELFIKNLQFRMPPKTLIVGSFDFSHDATVGITEMRDALSREILIQNKPEEIEKVSVDSKPGLYAFMRLMQIQKAIFHMDSNTNSSEILQRPDQPDVTSYIVGYYQ